MQSGSSTRLKWIRAAIVLMSVLLAVSVTAIGAQHLYWRFSEKVKDTAVVPDNVIGSRPASQPAVSSAPVSSQTASEPPESSVTVVPGTGTAQGGVTGTSQVPSQTVTRNPGGTGWGGDIPLAGYIPVSLYKGQPFENVPFDVTNMLPGDTYVNRFCIRINHKGSIIVYFWPKIISETKSLGDVLNLKVTRLDNNEVLCDTTFREQDGRYKAEIFYSTTTDEIESIAYYEVEVSMDTSVGNDYQAASLKADFYWSTEFIPYDTPPSPTPGDPPVIPPEEPGELTPPPQTGDGAKPVLWAALAVSSLGILLFLILRRRKEDDSDE